MNPYQNLNPVPDFGGIIRQGYLQGQKMRDDRDARQAAAAAMGGDQNALLKLYGIDPRLAASLEDALYQRGERQRTSEARGAMGDMLTGSGSNALMQYALPQGSAPTGPSPVPPAAMGGNQRSPQERLMRADPEGYLKFQGNRINMNESQLKLLKGVHDFGMQLLGGVHDQASYDAAKAQAASVYQQHGLPMPELPPQYSPELIHSLQMQGMDTDKQLLAIARENRLDWDVEDDKIDNAREQDEADDRATDRRARRSLTRRGQDLTDRRFTRGLDMTDKRVRGSAGYQGRGGKGGGKSDLIGPVQADASGRRIQFSKSKGAYVDLSTGEVVK